MKELAKKEIDEKDSNRIFELQKSSFKLQLVKKLAEIDSNYKQRVFKYKEQIQVYNIEIEKLKNKISIASTSYNKEEKILLMIEYELLFENKAYDSLQIKFSTYVNMIEEKELSILLDDIEVIELSLLNKELLRLNTLEIVEPKQLTLESLEMALKELEMNKAYFESMGLDKVSILQVENEDFWKQDNNEIVDTVEVHN
jgi:hypothetical protein